VNRLFTKVKALTGKTFMSIILLYAGVIVGSILLQFVPGDLGLGNLATPAGLVLSAWLMYAWFDKKKGWPVGWRDRRGAVRFLGGTVLAAVLIGTAVAALLLLGTVDVVPKAWFWGSIGLQIVLFLSVAAGEEWLFRGYLFGLYQHTAGVRTAFILNTLLFTVIHLLNPSSLSRPTEHIVIEMINIFLMGFLMSQARLYTGSLWMPVGLHFILNFLQSTVFGFVNGGKEVDSLLGVSYVQLNVWNGASHGLESSLILTPVLLLAVLTYGYAGKRRLARQAAASISG
jgi:uncharacterized protein